MEEILASIRRIIESGDDRTPVSARPRPVTEPLHTRMGTIQPEIASVGGRLPEPTYFQQPVPASDLSADPHAHAATPVGENDPIDDLEADWPPLASVSANDRPAAVLPLRRGAAVSPAETERYTSSHHTPFAREEERVAERLPPLAAHGRGADAAFLEGLRPATDEHPPRVERVESAARHDEPVVYDFNLEFDEESFSSELRDEVVSVFSQSEVRARDAESHGPAAAEALDVPLVADDAPASLISEASSLMSEAAGAQVASAFDELARSIREGQMKSMEEMARQMLRPMLQEWLDDNLPRIVERLVREEIERVAKGGRR
ncbi:hypothetical protein Sa4125_18780 [Aureimonas sp. SA4125]|uniref:PopZ family protein n=1 Tax=Aureimonas sp. SA4125 TaxID=2826993 RepID=UPI001CC53E7D|nr:DUF2497 domain-containing protein [Aureimonas sp. SA4125]BDA84336.1 hypothetical protein Sa4125_18780 [Aureimonas sp. SA4125]